MRYPLIIFTAHGLKDFGDGTYQAARAIGPVILIRPEKREDRGLVAHEVTHVGQWMMGLALGLLVAFLAAPHCPYWTVLAGLSIGLHHLAYALSPTYRMLAEVRAYRRQLRYYPDDRSDLFGSFLAKRYGLRITVAEALKEIRGSR